MPRSEAARPTLLLTRPEPDNRALARAARAAGFRTLGAPLLAIEPLAAPPPPPGVEALLLTSARAAPLARRALGEAATRLPVLAVGPATARAARRAGLRPVAVGAAGASAILAEAARLGYRHLLHARGEDRAAADLPPGLRVSELLLYRTHPAPALPGRVIAALGRGCVFASLLFSPRTALVFAGHVDRAGLDRAMLRLVALSPAVAEAAGPGFRAVAVACRPDTAASLAMARKLWQVEAGACRWTD